MGKRFAGLTVDQFQRLTSLIRIDEDSLRQSVSTIQAFSALEGLDAPAAPPPSASIEQCCAGTSLHCTWHDKFLYSLAYLVSELQAGNKKSEKRATSAPAKAYTQREMGLPRSSESDP